MYVCYIISCILRHVCGCKYVKMLRCFFSLKALFYFSLCKGMGSSALNAVNVLMLLEKLKRVPQLEAQKDTVNWILQVHKGEISMICFQYCRKLIWKMLWFLHIIPTYNPFTAAVVSWEVWYLTVLYLLLVLSSIGSIFAWVTHSSNDIFMHISHVSVTK